MKPRIRNGESMRVPSLARGLADSVAENTGWDKARSIAFLVELGACALNFNGCDAGREKQLRELYRASKAANRGPRLKSKIGELQRDHGHAPVGERLKEGVRG
jgi:hypothetical protein